MDLPTLHPDTIADVKARADIYEVVSSYVVLKKQGRDFQGLCPFHQERSPSFTVSPSKQMYYCFGCQAGGNAIKFLMEINQRSFAEVVLDLARQYNVSVRTLTPEHSQALQRQLTEREQLLEIMAMAVDFYQHALRQPIGQGALEYLSHQRQLANGAIQNFQLGYAPASWDALYHYLVVTKKFPAALVASAGLIVPRQEGNGYFDRFRHRLMIPINDGRGRPIAFGGRSLAGDNEGPKYLNSPDTPLFDKGQTLYGLDRAAATIKATDRALVVEGYFDVIALHSAGITSAVASLGTALSAHQIKQLLRFTESKQIVFNFDADRAGTQATHKAIAAVAELAYQGQVQLKVLNLPAGKDADEFLRSASAEGYQQQLTNAPLWLDWQLQRAIATVDLNDATAYQQAFGAAVKIIEKITRDHTRTDYVQRAALLLCGSDTSRLPLVAENLLTAIRRRATSKPRATSDPNPTEPEAEPEVMVSPHNRSVEQAETLLLRLYLHYPEHRLEIITALEEADVIFTLPHHRFIWQQIIAACEQGAIDYLDPGLIQYLQDLHGDHGPAMGQVGHLFGLDEKTASEIRRSPLVIRAAAACLEKAAWEQQRRFYLHQWQNSDLSPERQQNYYQLFYEAQAKLQALERQRLFTIGDLLGND